MSQPKNLLFMDPADRMEYVDALNELFSQLKPNLEVKNTSRRGIPCRVL